MDNKILEYLLNNDPDEVLSKNGVQLRKLINPLFRKVMMLFTSGKLEIVKRNDVPKDKKIIYFNYYLLLYFLATFGKSFITYRGNSSEAISVSYLLAKSLIFL